MIKVLDVGCWEGKRVRHLCEKGFDAYGIDINKQRILNAPDDIKERLFYGDITKEVRIKDKFDVIYLTDVLEHIKEDSKALRNIYKLLKKGGFLVLTTPRSTLFQLYDPAWIRWKFGGERHYHYSGKELALKLKLAGFKYISAKLTGTFRWLFVRWLNVFLRYVIRTKKQIPCGRGDGHFNWEVIVQK